MWNMNYFTFNFVKILNHSFLAVENIHCYFQNVEDSNCTFKHCGKYHNVLTVLWKLSMSLPTNYLNYLSVTLRIFDHLEHFFHIS